MIVKLVMFLSSYAPVFGLLAFRSPFVLASVILTALAVVGILGLLIVVNWTKQKSQTTFSVVNRRDAGAEASGFLAAYLLPLLAFDMRDPYFYWASGVFLCLALVVSMRSSMIQVNPLLFLGGYRVIAVEVKAREESNLVVSRYLLSRKDARIGDEIDAYRLGGGVLLRA